MARGRCVVDQVTKALVQLEHRRGRPRRRLPGRRARPRAQPRRRVRRVRRRRHDRRAWSSPSRSSRCSVWFVRHTDTPLAWLPTGLLLGGAVGNIFDRIRDGAVTDFIKFPRVAGVQRRRHRDHVRRAEPALRPGAGGAMLSASAKLTPASASTRSWPGPLGSRARAQRLIEAGAVTVDGARGAQAPPDDAGRGRRRRRGRRARAGRRPDRRPRDVRASPTRTSTCSSSTSPRASSCIRRAGTAHGHAGAGAGGPRAPAARTRTARGSCTAWTATPPGCSSSRSPTRCTARSRRRCSAARSCASTSRSSRAARRRASGTIDAPIGRDRRVRTRMSTDTDAPREAVTHFDARARAAALDAAARAAADRPHAPDPRPPAGDRPPGRAATRSTARRACYGLERQFLHAEHLAFAHPVTGEPVDVHSPLPADLAAALERATVEA